MYDLRSRISAEKTNTTHAWAKGCFKKLLGFMDIWRFLASPVAPILTKKTIKITSTIKNG